MAGELLDPRRMLLPSAPPGAPPAGREPSRRRPSSPAGWWYPSGPGRAKLLVMAVATAWLPWLSQGMARAGNSWGFTMWGGQWCGISHEQPNSDSCSGSSPSRIFQTWTGLCSLTVGSWIMLPRSCIQGPSYHKSWRSWEKPGSILSAIAQSRWNEPHFWFNNPWSFRWLNKMVFFVPSLMCHDYTQDRTGAHFLNVVSIWKYTYVDISPVSINGWFRMDLPCSLHCSPKNSMKRVAFAICLLYKTLRVAQSTGWKCSIGVSVNEVNQGPIETSSLRQSLDG